LRDGPRSEAGPVDGEHLHRGLVGIDEQPAVIDHDERIAEFFENAVTNHGSGVEQTGTQYTALEHPGADRHCQRMHGVVRG